MKIYGQRNVREAVIDRLRWVFREFPNVVACVSGGKDSTVLFNLTLEVARELGRLPLRVMFIDQEAEWASTVEQVRSIMEHPDVDPLWLQVPIRLFNASSTVDHWLHCWDPAARDRWVHPQHPLSLKVNPYGTDRFHQLFTNVLRYHYPSEACAYVSGVRTEESVVRYIGLTSAHVYKGVSYGKTLDKRRRHYTFYPLYDWSYTDVWKAICDGGWAYNRIYDLQYKYGVSVTQMRVSNVHHETALESLFYLQEAEPETYRRLTARIAGIDAMGKLARDFFVPSTLPVGFDDWRSYRDFLLDTLIDDPDWRRRFLAQFARQEGVYVGTPVEEKMYKCQINSVLINDWEAIRITHFDRRPECMDIRRRGVMTWSWQKNSSAR